MMAIRLLFMMAVLSLTGCDGNAVAPGDGEDAQALDGELDGALDGGTDSGDGPTDGTGDEGLPDGTGDDELPDGTGDEGLPDGTIVLATDTFRYEIASDGYNRGFYDAQGDLLTVQTPFALVWKGESSFPATAITRTASGLDLAFATAGARATLRVTSHAAYLVFEVESIAGEGIDRLTFLDIPLALRGRESERFGVCALALNLETQVTQPPVLQSRATAQAWTRLGIEGARVALIGEQPAHILPVVKEVLQGESELPFSQVGGPWAREIPANAHSYLINLMQMTPNNVDQWIQLAQRLGFKQIDNHGGDGYFQWGDFATDAAIFEAGWDTFKQMNEQLAGSGIASLLHTYSFFVSKRSRYVRPVPSPHLDAFRTFTLAAPISASDTSVVVHESTAGVSTVTGFLIRNSVVLHVGDELMTFSGVTSTPPYTFTGVQRGAHGTTAAAHASGVPVRHLKEMFGCFVPHPDSPLFEEVAHNQATIVNDCGFSGFYFDAIDGAGILAGDEFAWYHAGRFITLVQKYLTRDVGMEMSAMWHHFWPFRSRYGAWDVSVRGHNRFLDYHLESVDAGLMLPLNLGWWNPHIRGSTQEEPTFPEVLDYLGSKLIGHNAGLSMLMDPATASQYPAFVRAMDQIGVFERVRAENPFDAAAKGQLGTLGKEFVLEQDDQGKWGFRPATTFQAKAVGRIPEFGTFVFANPYDSQPIRFRIETLSAAGPFGAQANVSLASFDGSDGFAVTAPAGVTATFVPSTVDGKQCGLLTATRDAAAGTDATWAMAEKVFPGGSDLSQHQALGVWLHGNGEGHLVSVRLSNEWANGTGIADHYLDITFPGWAYVEMIESESTRHADYAWPEQGFLGWHSAHQGWVNLNHVDKLSLLVNGLQPGQTVQTCFGPIEAMPLAMSVVSLPVLTLNGNPVTLYTEMGSGTWLECNPDCKVYTREGELLGSVATSGPLPQLVPGANTVQLTSQTSGEVTTRVQFSVFMRGARVE